jgi:molybdopterin synthase catalytic subunit
MIELVQGALSPERCLEEVRRSGSGGIVTFVGSVRELSEGKRVRYLEYEAYEPMALEKLAQVVRETCERWPVNAMAIQHRLGRLEIGEDAVVIAVSCPHRAEAFEACHYAIDRLKQVVPIWKKEYGEDGAVWVGGPTLPTTAPTHGRGPG